MQSAGASNSSGRRRQRRLSSGRKLLEADEEEEEEEVATESPSQQDEERKIDSETSEEVAEMYRRVIKMASENKITAKNAWSLSLIDHMSSVVDNNFQRASCTLEAGVKIYCGRVDDTWETSYRVLERLHRRSRPSEEAPPRAEEAPTKRRPAPSTLVDEASIELSFEGDEGDDEALIVASRGLEGGSARALLLQKLACVAARVSFEDIVEDDDGADLKVAFDIDLPGEVCPALAALRLDLGDTHPPEVPDDSPEISPPPAEPNPDPDPDPDEDSFFAVPDDDYDDNDVGEESSRAPVYFDEEDVASLDALKGLGRNGWAGVSHWKLARRPPPRATTTTTTKPRQRQQQKTLDFDAPPPPLSILAPAPKRKSAAPRKARPEDLVLPVDFGISPRDLFKLFLLDRTLPSKTRRDPRERDPIAFDDPVAVPMHHDDDDDGFAPHATEDSSFREDEDPAAAPDLLEAAHRVEKIDISYATSAKRVDVHKLKAALWHVVDARTKNDHSLRFSSLVKQADADDVTLPFHFIALLHLCNENSIYLRNLPEAGLSDFSISRDAA
ncbi:hypothetical protein CTAYLR_007024 [Chrysophaeum taylorii]|uniref:Condensin complex subunit 2 n=1 Tax=Chrysophaeum taylorii TaxID=2483200 RepID=A0AAD7U6Y3_9STRA|nr:hypothetical protein CTAYLR_007024 [Chrysophaeum taylorii]